MGSERVSRSPTPKPAPRSSSLRAHEYTDEARRAGAEGTVTLRAGIYEEGCVVQVEVLEGLPHGLTESAVEAARRAVFRPAMENGEPVGARY